MNAHRLTLLGLLSLAILWGCSASPVADEKNNVTDVKIISPWPGKVRESSALAKYNDTLWTLNDSGDKPRIYGINQDHKVSSTLTLKGATNLDWEEMAQDGEHLYVFDSGNNRGRRNVFQIYKTNWLDITNARDGEKVPTEILQFSYADKPEKVNSRAHNFDCEAVAMVNNELWLFTKNRKDQHTNLYILDKNAKHQKVSPQANFPVKGLITAADYDAKSGMLALLGYEKSMLFGQSFIWLIPVEEDLPIWDKAQRHTLAPYGQWEAIMWDRGSDSLRLLLTTESTPLLSVSLGEITFPKK